MSKDNQDVRRLVTYIPNVFLCAYVCESWDYVVFVWVIIVIIGSVFSFMKFGGQTSKKVYYVWNICLERTLCVLVCFVEFYVFVMDELGVGVLNLYMNIFKFKNSGKKVPKDQPRFLQEGPFVWAKGYLDQPKWPRQLTASRLVDTPFMEGLGQYLA